MQRFDAGDRCFKWRERELVVVTLSIRRAIGRIQGQLGEIELYTLGVRRLISPCTWREK